MPLPIEGRMLELTTFPNKCQLNNTALQMKPALEAVLSECENLSEAAEIELHIYATPPHLQLDEAHFKDVLRNLTNKATKYGGT